jgi:hypothetical protein
MKFVKSVPTKDGSILFLINAVLNVCKKETTVSTKSTREEISLVKGYMSLRFDISLEEM